MSSTRRNFLKGLGIAAVLPVMPATGRETPLAEGKAGQHRVLTCNIRVALGEDETKGVGWSTRKEACLRIIGRKNADIIALQEVLKVQADDFTEHFSSHQLIGFHGPEMDAHTTGYHGVAKNPILFSKKRYTLLAAGTYWLSETPLVAGSKSWGTARARHANWLRLKDKTTGHQLRVTNLHLDHVSEEAKIKQVEMVVAESAQYQPAFAQVLTGDFNARFDSAVMNSVRSGGWKESYETVHGAGEAGFTGHAFEGVNYDKGASKGRIDYTWYRGKIKPVACEIIKDAIDGKYPSDHFFMQTDFELE